MKIHFKMRDLVLGCLVRGSLGIFLVALSLTAFHAEAFELSPQYGGTEAVGPDPKFLTPILYT
jgi:hypothetical protein